MAKEVKKKEHSTLTEYEVFEEDNRLYIKLVYILEDDHKIEKLTMPKVGLPIYVKNKPKIDNQFDFVEEIGPFRIPHQSCKFSSDNGHNWLKVFKGKVYDTEDVLYTVETIEERATEMTLEEIEKKLGYKVKVVTKKEAAK